MYVQCKVKIEAVYTEPVWRMDSPSCSGYICIIDQVWGQDSGITDVILCVFQRRKQGTRHACCVWHSLLASCSPEKRKKVTPVMRGSFFKRTVNTLGQWRINYVWPKQTKSLLQEKVVDPDPHLASRVSDIIRVVILCVCTLASTIKDS